MAAVAPYLIPALASGFWGAVGVGAIAGFTGGMVGTRLHGGSWNDAFKNGLKGAAAGALMGGISGGFGDTWHFGRVMVTGMGGGASSEIMGGEFSDGFKVAFITAAAAYAYSAYSTEYNTNNGKPHIFQDGKSDVGIHDLKKEGITYDTSTTKTIGKIPTFDSMAEFHDGWTREVSWLAKPGMLQVSIIPAIGINLAATYNQYYNAFEAAKYYGRK